MAERDTADGKRRSSQAHATRAYTCTCGKVCHGNGGWSSHRKACSAHQEGRAARLAVSCAEAEKVGHAVAAPARLD
ncbi:MAG: hypothetical protein HKL99_10820 [Burkholderiales bacterium]|nr:hypothetical protein [Burkholderiales bacterium]